MQGWKDVSRDRRAHVERPNSDERKVRIAREVRERTTVPLRFPAQELTRISHEMVVQLHKILRASRLRRLRHIRCDMVRKPQPVGGQKIKEMRRQSVRSAG